MHKAYIENLPIGLWRNQGQLLAELVPGPGNCIPAFVIAINAEKVVRARKDRAFGALMASGSHLYPDGIGVVWVLRIAGYQVSRIAGADLWLALMKRAEQHKLRVFLVGGRPEVLDRTVSKLLVVCPSLEIVGARDGYSDPDLAANLKKEIELANPHIVTVGLGTPLQEQLIQKLWIENPTRCYMGVGGTYDAFTGVVQRAPLWIQRAGLEWLYRLIREPSRAGRQKAILQFAGAVIIRRIRAVSAVDPSANQP